MGSTKDIMLWALGLWPEILNSAPALRAAWFIWLRAKAPAVSRYSNSERSSLTDFGWPEASLLANSNMAASRLEESSRSGAFRLSSPSAPVWGMKIPSLLVAHILGYPAV